jgi:hypothetical protein
MDTCCGVGCTFCEGPSLERHIFRKRDGSRQAGKLPGERSKRRWYRFWMPGGTPSVKQLENRRIRSLERVAVRRGDDLPKAQGNATRWDPWNWD